MAWWCNCFGKSYEAPEVLELDYRHSSLTEVPPDVFTFERTLEKLCLASNQISDLPPSLFHCYELRELDLGDNELTTIPTAIGSLTRLVKLDASRNSISEVAEGIKSCKNLTSLDLSLNHLVKLPEGISQLVSLEELNLNDTYLEFLHANFGRLVKLKVLELRENSLQSLPKSMTRFNHLLRLDVGQNDLHELPEVVGTMTNLLELWVDNNSLRSIPSIVGNLTKLTSIDASSNDIIEIADEIGRCTHLTEFSFSQNSIEGLPDTFPKLESLTVLRLDSNQIQYLPEDFGNLKSLQELSIIRNLLKALPPSIGLLRKLHTLLLDDNLLSELPKEIGSCSALTVLHAAKNRLSRIPSEIGHLTNLKVLALAGNLILHLPVSILNIPKLGALWLSESQSKPLLPLNKETDPYTGEHVITCYLLPQLPNDNNPLSNGAAEEVPENPTRPRRSLIKFAGFDDEEVEEVPEEAAVNVNPRPGLLRAPTPYPKELRALAKHASQVYTNTRQAKDQNGDLSNTDTAEHEAERSNGDARGNNHSHRAHSKPGTAGPEQNQAAVNSELSRRASEEFFIEAQRRSGDILREVELRKIQQRLRPAYYAPTTFPPLPSASLPRPPMDLPDSAWAPSYGSQSGSELAAKTPPPYHIAARRAAFFKTQAGPATYSKEEVEVREESSNSFTQIQEMIERLEGDTKVLDLETRSTQVKKDYESAKVTLTEKGMNERPEKEVWLHEKSVIESIVRSAAGANGPMTVETTTSTSTKASQATEDQARVPYTGHYIHPLSTTALASVANAATTTMAGPPTRLIASDSFSRIPVYGSGGPPKAPDSRGSYSRIPAYQPPSTHVPESSRSSSTSSGLGSGSGSSRIPKFPAGPHNSSLNNRQPDPGPAAPLAYNNPSRVSFGKAGASGGDSSSSLLLKRVPSGSRIPKRTTPSPPPEPNNRFQGPGGKGRIPPSPPGSPLRESSSPDSMLSSSTSSSRIPTLQSSGSGRKPWIFGTHKNARVVPLEYKKINSLGFSVCNAVPGNPADNGVFVESIEEPAESTVKIGDKILQVDGIDVSKMSLDIVRKILSNCQDSINLLVSREN